MRERKERERVGERESQRERVREKESRRERERSRESIVHALVSSYISRRIVRMRHSELRHNNLPIRLAEHNKFVFLSLNLGEWAVVHGPNGLTETLRYSHSDSTLTYSCRILAVKPLLLTQIVSLIGASPDDRLL